jgi:hypothetical protein
MAVLSHQARYVTAKTVTLGQTPFDRNKSAGRVIVDVVTSQVGTNAQSHQTIKDIRRTHQ